VRLTPKNWKSFQHYKNRKPQWIKLHKELLDDYEFSCLPVASRALAPCLWLLASEYRDGVIEASEEKLAFRLRMSRDEFCSALKPLIDAGFFDGEPIASKPLADCKQSASLEREKEGEREKEKERDGALRASVGLEFDRFWEAYPKRGASNPRKPALDKFTRLTKSGISAARIIGGAAAYAGECEKLKIINTEKVAQAITWLNQERFNDYADQAKTPEQQAVIDLDMARRGYAWIGGKWVQTSTTEGINANERKA